MIQKGKDNDLMLSAILSERRFMGYKLIFQQDSDPNDTSKLCTNYLKNEEDAQIITKTEWIPQLPRVSHTQF